MYGYSDDNVHRSSITHDRMQFESEFGVSEGEITVRYS